MKKIVTAFFYSENHFRSLKFAYQIWTSINFSGVNGYCMRKRIKQRICTRPFKKIVRVAFSRHTLRKAKILLLNSNFHNFFCSKRLIHIRKNMSKGVYASSFKKIVRTVLETLTSSLISGSPYFGFSISTKMWKYYLYISLALCIKCNVSIAISFGDIKRWLFPSQSHIYTDRPVFKNNFFGFMGLRKI